MQLLFVTDAVHTAAVSKVGGLRMQEDLAIPFLPAPANLDKSLPGYAGFDPLGFATGYDVKWLQVKREHNTTQESTALAECALYIIGLAGVL